MGRMVNCFLPTPAFGLLHPVLPQGIISEKRGIGQNDILKVSIPGNKPSNGKNLVVVAWGPDSKWIAQTLSAEGIESTMLVLSYMKAPNSLITYLANIAR